MSTGFFLGLMNILELVMMVGQPCEYTNMHRIVNFKMVTSMVYEFYVSKNTEIIKGITYAQKNILSKDVLKTAHRDSFRGGDKTGR